MKTTVNDYIQDLLLETHDLEAFLNALTHITAESMSVEGGEVLCGITLRRHKRAGTVASNNAMAQRLDEVQYGFDEGPCLSACAEQRIFNIPDIKHETRWVEYFHEIMDSGVRSTLAVPLQLDTGDTAAINLYSVRVHGFDQHAVQRVQAYAEEASTLLNLAVRMARHRDNEENLRLALASRTTIDLAVGIIMGQNKCSQERAMEILKSASSTRNIKLRTVAETVIASTTNHPVETYFEP